MKNHEFYKKSQNCASQNGNETVTPKSDVLVCKKFEGVCSLVRCLNGHNNTQIGKVV